MRLQRDLKKRKTGRVLTRYNFRHNKKHSVGFTNKPLLIYINFNK